MLQTLENNTKTQNNYIQNPIKSNSPVIDGYFYKERTVKDMTIRKINITLGYLLGFSILMAFFSYYFVMRSEQTLNNLNKQIVALNDTNFEQQNKLDKMKSFNNVDKKMMQSHILKKADKVIEVPEITTTDKINKIKIASAPFKWTIGY